MLYCMRQWTFQNHSQEQIVKTCVEILGDKQADLHRLYLTRLTVKAEKVSRIHPSTLNGAPAPPV